MATNQFIPTDEQKLILDHNPNNHARVLAGPGTGKSAIMVMYIMHLKNIDKYFRVRMLTFTRAATAELLTKVQNELNSEFRPITLHSFAISVLLNNHGAGDIPYPLRIADTWETKNVVEPTFGHRAQTTATKIRDFFLEMEANFQSLENEQNHQTVNKEHQRLLAVWDEHRRIFGYTLLSEIPFALLQMLKHQHEIKGIENDLLIVDEYQDLNACDLEVIHLVSELGGGTVIGTGDDDQSIYSWRKAAPHGIRRFCDDYRNAADYTLSITQRCGKNIIEWANHVIANDPERPSERAVLSSKIDSPDGTVALLRFENNEDEVNGVAELVMRLIDQKKLLPHEILILARTDYQRRFSGPIRAELEKRNIVCTDSDYVQEILNDNGNRKILELFRLLVHQEDSISWASLLRLTPRVGEKFIAYIYEHAKSKGITFAKSLLDSHQEEFPSGPSSSKVAQVAVSEILNWLSSIEIPNQVPQEGWGQWILDQVESDPTLTPSDGFRSLLLDVDSFMEGNQQFVRYLSQVEPFAKDIAHGQGDGVRFMTMGGSKGLTVKAAIIVGLEEGVIPRPSCDLSEERRFLYVALTRSREYVFCTWSARRQGPSSFVGSQQIRQRGLCNFLVHGPVVSQNGIDFLNGGF